MKIGWKGDFMSPTDHKQRVQQKQDQQKNQRGASSQAFGKSDLPLLKIDPVAFPCDVVFGEDTLRIESGATGPA